MQGRGMLCLNLHVCFSMQRERHLQLWKAHSCCVLLQSLNAGVFKPVLYVAFLLAWSGQLETRACGNKKQEVVSMKKNRSSQPLPAIMSSKVLSFVFVFKSNSVNYKIVEHSSQEVAGRIYTTFLKRRKFPFFVKH